MYEDTWGDNNDMAKQAHANVLPKHAKQTNKHTTDHTATSEE